MGTATSTGGGLGKDSLLRKESAKCYRNIRRDEASTAWSRLQGVERGDVFKETNRSSRLQKRKQAQTTAPGSSSLLRQDGGVRVSPEFPERHPQQVSGRPTPPQCPSGFLAATFPWSLQDLPS